MTSAAPLAGHFRNAFGNLAASGLLVVAWGCVGIWTVHTVGAEWWGLISLLGAGQALAASLDFGLSYYVTRRVANRIKRRSCETLLSACEAMAVGCSVVLLLGAIFAWALGAGSHFSHGGTLSPDLLSRAVGLLILSVALGYPAFLYRAVLAGLGSQRTYSRALGFFGAAKILVVVPVIMATGRLDLAILGTCVVSAAESVICRWLAIRAIGSFSMLRTTRKPVTFLIRRSVLNGSYVSLAGANAALERIVVAASLGLSVGAVYNSAWMLCSLALQALHPITQATYPQVCVSASDPDRLQETFRTLTRLVAFLFVPACWFCLALATPLASIWFSDPNLKSIMILFSAILIFGAALNSQTVLGWCLALAMDRPRPMLYVALLSLAFTVVALPAAISAVGSIAAPSSWLFANLAGIAVPGVIAARRLRNPRAVARAGAAIIAAIAAPAVLLVVVAS